MMPTTIAAKAVAVVVAKDDRVPTRVMMIMKQIAVPDVEARWDHPWVQDEGAAMARSVDSAPLSTIAEMTTPAVNTTGMNTPIAMAGVVMDRADSNDTVTSHSAKCTTRDSHASGSVEVMALEMDAEWHSVAADGTNSVAGPAWPMDSVAAAAEDTQAGGAAEASVIRNSVT